MLLLHGLGATGDVWRGYDGIAPDLPGHGASPWDAPYTFEKLAESVAPLLTRPMPVIGHSMGGVVALTLALKYPAMVTKVVGLGIKVDWSEDDVAKAKALAEKPSPAFDTWEEAVQRFLKVSGLIGLTKLPLDNAVVETVRGWTLTQDPATFGVGVPDMAGLLETVRCDVVLARGEHDPMVSDEELAALVPDPVALKGLGHNAHFEDRDAVLALL